MISSTVPDPRTFVAFAAACVAVGLLMQSVPADSAGFFYVAFVSGAIALFIDGASEPDESCPGSSNGTHADIDQSVVLSNGKTLADMVKIADPEVLRSTDPCGMIRNGGELFVAPDSRVGARDGECVYNLSSRTEAVDEFISHTWHCERWIKFLCLAIHYRSVPAVVWGTAAGGVAAAAQYYGLTEFGKREERLGPEHPVYEVGVLGFWASNAVMIAMLFASPSVLAFPGSRRTRCFFDKVCMNLEDPEMRLKSIHSLGGILARSKRMTVVWSETYFDRLWCVFEVACFTATRGFNTATLKFLPVMDATFLVTSSLACFVGIAIWELQVMGGDEVIDKSLGPQFGSYAMIISASVHLFTFWANFYAMYKHEECAFKLSLQLRSFSVKNCKCFDPADRDIVEGCIRGWFGSLDAFDTLVREKLRPALESHFGMSPTSYGTAICCTWHLFFFLSDVLPYGSFLSAATLVQMLVMSGMIFCIFPLEICLWSYLARVLQQQKFRGIPTAVKVGITGTAMMMLHMTLHLASFKLCDVSLTFVGEFFTTAFLGICIHGTRKIYGR